MKGKIGKGGAGGAGAIKFAVGADASVPDMTSESSENRASSQGFLKASMKTMVDAFMAAYLSGMIPVVMVALKYYVVNAVEKFADSMVGVGFADDA